MFRLACGALWLSLLAGWLTDCGLLALCLCLTAGGLALRFLGLPGRLTLRPLLFALWLAPGSWTCVLLVLAHRLARLVPFLSALSLRLLSFAAG